MQGSTGATSQVPRPDPGGPHLGAPRVKRAWWGYPANLAGLEWLQELQVELRTEGFRRSPGLWGRCWET